MDMLIGNTQRPRISTSQKGSKFDCYILFIADARTPATANA